MAWPTVRVVLESATPLVLQAALWGAVVTVPRVLCGVPRRGSVPAAAMMTERRSGRCGVGRAFFRRVRAVCRVAHAATLLMIVVTVLDELFHPDVLLCTAALVCATFVVTVSAAISTCVHNHRHRQAAEALRDVESGGKRVVRPLRMTLIAGSVGVIVAAAVVAWFMFTELWLETTVSLVAGISGTASCLLLSVIALSLGFTRGPSGLADGTDGHSRLRCFLKRMAGFGVAWTRITGAVLAGGCAVASALFWHSDGAPLDGDVLDLNSDDEKRPVLRIILSSAWLTCCAILVRIVTWNKTRALPRSQPAVFQGGEDYDAAVLAALASTTGDRELAVRLARIAGDDFDREDGMAQPLGFGNILRRFDHRIEAQDIDLVKHCGGAAASNTPDTAALLTAARAAVQPIASTAKAANALGAIRAYTEETGVEPDGKPLYAEINKVLRDPRRLSECSRERLAFIRLLNYALSKLAEPNSPPRLIRAIPNSWTRSRRPQRFWVRQFLSATTCDNSKLVESFETALAFAADSGGFTVFIIDPLDSGSRVRRVQNISTFPDEREWLFPTNTPFDVTSSEQVSCGSKKVFDVVFCKEGRL